MSSTLRDPVTVDPINVSPTAEAVAIAIPASAPARIAWSTVSELTKPRITRLVTITSAVGFVMSAVSRPVWFSTDLIVAAIGSLAGTALSAAGASALNQWAERRRDALMPRTANRPLPENRISASAAFWIGLALCAAGLITLFTLAGPSAALVSLATILMYVLLYTPLKPVTTLATIIGAVPGALPPLIGWCGAAHHPLINPMDPLFQSGGWALFLLMFVWQIPHFLAIAWMYREDYAKGGYRILPLFDPTGARTAWTILLWAAALIPATLAPSIAMPERLGSVYPIAAILTGGFYLVLCTNLVRDHSRDNARRVFIASIMHLPLLLVIMVVDAVVTAIV